MTEDSSGPLPVVAIVGRPNVGKSTLVNRFLGRRAAVVQDTPGVTRDRIAYEALWNGKRFTVLDAGVALDDKVAVARAVSEATIEVGTDARREKVTVDGVDVRKRIRGAEVTRAVSPVSAVPAVRRLLVARQRELVAGAHAVVVEGRDIGTVVLPGATLKIYLTASPEVRAQRRAAQLGVTDPDKIAALAADLRRRDDYDSRRADSPLRPAEDAVVVDSTDLAQEETVARVVALAMDAIGAGQSA